MIHESSRTAFAVILLASVSNLGAAIFQQAYLKASNTGVEDVFGRAVAMSGDTLVIGAPGEASATAGVNGNQANNAAPYSGAAYVFVRNGNAWTQQAYLKASNTGSNDQFGLSVAISGDTIVVGAPYESSNARGVGGSQSNNSATNAGAAYVFVRNGTVWSQQAYLKASNTDPEDQFGWSVAISGDTIVVGAPFEDSEATGVNDAQADNNAPSAGAAYVFVRNGTTWSQQAYLKASNTDAEDLFAMALSICGNTIAVGAWQEDSFSAGVNGNELDNTAGEAGAAYVFVRNGTTWSQQAYLKASNTEAQDLFGLGIAIDGDTLVVGALGEDSAAVGVNGNQLDNSVEDSGAAYVFVRNGTVWSQQAYLKASNTRSNVLGSAMFAFALAVHGDRIVVTAHRETSNATGVNGNQANTDANEAGAAYVFSRGGTTWTQRAYLKASNTEAGDYFGTSVALSGPTIAIGAIYEASGSLGVNANQADNSAPSAGAAYVFFSLESPTTLSIVPAGYFIRFTGNPGTAYDIQRAPTVNGPWSTIATVTAPPSGAVEYHDANPPHSQSFYRSVE